MKRVSDSETFFYCTLVFVMIFIFMRGTTTSRCNIKSERELHTANRIAIATMLLAAQRKSSKFLFSPQCHDSYSDFVCVCVFAMLKSFGCLRAWRLQLLLTKCFFDTLSSTESERF